MYHASPSVFDTFNTAEVFLSKTEAYARKYGPHMYRVTYEGSPLFETPTIVVVRQDQIKEVVQLS